MNITHAHSIAAALGATLALATLAVAQVDPPEPAEPGVNQPNVVAVPDEPAAEPVVVVEEPVAVEAAPAMPPGEMPAAPPGEAMGVPAPAMTPPVPAAPPSATPAAAAPRPVAPEAARSSSGRRGGEDRRTSSRDHESSERGGRTDDRPSTPAAATQPSPRPGTSTLPADHYNVVSERNIFLRERRRPVVPTTRRPDTRPAATLESSLVLRGVVLEEGAFRAYFENTQANQLLRVAAGDALAKGHVVEISIDAVAFESAGALIWVKVGDNLVGSRVASAAPTPSASSSSQPAGNLSSIEERMRQRREQRDGGRR